MSSISNGVKSRIKCLDMIQQRKRSKKKRKKWKKRSRASRALCLLLVGNCQKLNESKRKRRKKRRWSDSRTSLRHADRWEQRELVRDRRRKWRRICRMTSGESERRRLRREWWGSWIWGRRKKRDRSKRIWNRGVCRVFVEWKEEEWEWGKRESICVK